MKYLNIYTDGACSGNQDENNVGGWGAILEFGPVQKELFGSERNTSNNRMEMTALLEALKAITKEKQKIRVFSDSSYLMECFRKKWYEEWQQNGWKTKAKKPVENRDLWEELLLYIGKHDAEFYRVKGHVPLSKPQEFLMELYDKFLQWNGPNFSYDDFIYIQEKNKRADALANMGIDELVASSLP